MRAFVGTRLGRVFGHSIYGGISERIHPGRALLRGILFLGGLTWIGIIFWIIYFRLGLSAIKP